MRKWHFILFFIILISFLGVCKKNETQKPEQILGTRYSRFDQYIYSRAGSSKKADKVALVYALEEVTGLEVVEEKKTQYLKLKTVTGKEGYAPFKNFTEGVWFVVKEGANAFRKPTPTAGTKGKLNVGSICFIEEEQADWVNARCLSAHIKDGELEDWNDVWIQPSEAYFSKDPLIGQTALLIREATKLLLKTDSFGPDHDSLMSKAKEKLTAAYEKDDIYKGYIIKLAEEKKIYFSNQGEAEIQQPQNNQGYPQENNQPYNPNQY
ncbi:MAG: lipoprotein LenA [Leptospiraceae bacterium]|nr:lipoprotein LenA [Leptospiraceae bacterium]